MFADRLSPKVSVGVVYVLALFMTIMDTTIVNVALPRLGRDFGVQPAHVNTVVVGYLVSLAVFMPTSAWLGNRFGTRRVFLTALVVFVVASALCGVAQSVGQLVLFRVLQGVGGGMLTPVGMAMLFRVFAPHERVRASRILIFPIATAPALGPVLGGLLTTDLSWRWAFYINVPIGLCGLVFGLLFVREQAGGDAGAFDLSGFILAGVGLGSLMFALSDGPARGWTSPVIDTCAAIGVVLLGVLVFHELRTSAPMLDLRVLSNRLFANTSSVVVTSTTAFLGSLFLVSLFYQDGFGVSPLQSGLSTFPEAIGIMLGAQSASRLYPHVGPRRLMCTGLVGVATTLVLIAQVPFSANLWIMRVFLFILGFAQAHVFVPGQAASFATISNAEMAPATTLFNAGRQLGSAAGVAILSTVISAVGVVHVVAGHALPNATAYHAAFLTAAGIAALALVMAVRISDADAEPSMRKIASDQEATPLTEAVA